MGSVEYTVAAIKQIGKEMIVGVCECCFGCYVALLSVTEVEVVKSLVGR